MLLKSTSPRYGKNISTFKLNIPLPNLNNYKDDFIQNGLTLPLQTISPNEDGLLKALPKADPNNTGWPWNAETDPSVYSKKLKWPKFTIVCPSFNQGAFIEQTIRSVLLQNYPNLEFIIMDGGSTDGTIDVVKKYSEWISFWQSKPDEGQANAINQGFSISSGKYLAWINSDDYYTRGTFIKVVQSFMATGVDFIYGYGRDYLVKSETFLPVAVILPVLDSFIRFPSLRQPSCFWTRNIHQPLWEELHCALDYELWIRMLKGKKRKLIKEVLSVASIHDQAKTHDAAMKNKWEEDHRLICGVNAHGPVLNWDKMAKIHLLMIRLYSLFNKKPKQ